MNIEITQLDKSNPQSLQVQITFETNMPVNIETQAAGDIAHLIQGYLIECGSSGNVEIEHGIQEANQSTIVDDDSFFDDFKEISED